MLADDCAFCFALLYGENPCTEPFHPFERLLEFRQMQDPNTPGEPKLAKQFLAELEQERP